MQTVDQQAIDLRRGHDFYPDQSTLDLIPDLYDTENTPLAVKTFHLHYFLGGCDWFVAELDKHTGEAFGWAQLLPGCGEWGYFSLPELAETQVHGLSAGRMTGLLGEVQAELLLIDGTLLVERDLYWRPTLAEDALDRF